MLHSTLIDFFFSKSFLIVRQTRKTDFKWASGLVSMPELRTLECYV